MIRLPSSSSFPSSHAAMSTAAAIVLSEARPELVPLWAALAGAMCLSRLYVGAHHAGDVAAGVALGAVTGGACGIWRSREGQWHPAAGTAPAGALQRREGFSGGGSGRRGG